MGAHAPAPGAVGGVRAREPLRPAHPRGRPLRGRGGRPSAGGTPRVTSCSVELPAPRAVGRATAAWLDAIGLPFDDLQCPAERVEMCVREGIELLVDDSPLSIAGALEHGIVAATIVHPWNEEVCEEEDVICARDWHELARLLAPVVSAPVDAGELAWRAARRAQRWAHVVRIAGCDRRLQAAHRRADGERAGHRWLARRNSCAWRRDGERR